MKDQWIKTDSDKLSDLELKHVQLQADYDRLKEAFEELLKDYHSELSRTNEHAANECLSHYRNRAGLTINE